MRPVAVYSALRVGLFLVVVLVLRVLGVGGVLSLVVAVVVALLLSFVVLRRQRDAVTRVLMARDRARRASGRPRRRSFGDRLTEDAAAEDAADASGTTAPPPAAGTPDVPDRRSGRGTT